MTEKHYSWKSQEFWVRVFYMLVVGVIAHFAIMLTWLLLMLQFLVTLVTGEPSRSLMRFGRSAGLYVAAAFAFIGFASENKPFPFSDWPR